MTLDLGDTTYSQLVCAIARERGADGVVLVFVHGEGQAGPRGEKVELIAAMRRGDGDLGALLQTIADGAKKVIADGK